MNWGYKILLTILSFIALMIFFVVIAVRQSNELMDSNYYDEELKYQTKINASSQLNEQFRGQICNKSNDRVQISIPVQFLDQFKEGMIHFINYQSSRGDVTESITPDSNGKFDIPLSRFKIKGSFLIRISWKTGDKEYYKVEEIII